MELSNLETFVDIAETKSFSQSAKNLNLSQPAVSKRIATLESVLMIKLFDRAGGQVKLTEFGELLLPSARQIQAELVRIEDAIGATREEVGGRLRVGATDYIAKYKLPKILKRFRDSYPDVAVDVRFGACEEIIAGMDTERFELGLISFLEEGVEEVSEKLDSIEVWREKVVTVVAVDHPLNHAPLSTIQNLKDVPALWPASESSHRKSIERRLSEHSVECNPLVESNDFELIRILASHGLGWACIPGTMVDNTLAELPIAELRDTQVVRLVRHKDRTLTRAAGAFLEMLPSN